MSDNDIFIERVEKAVNDSCDKWSVCNSFGFLNLAEQSLALSIFQRENFFNYSLFGGYDDAVRKCLSIGNEYDIPEPELSFIKIIPDKFNTVEHRDYMGAVLGLGIDRKIIGDIIEIDDRSAYIVIYDKNGMADYICNNLNRVGKASVKVTRVDYLPHIIPCFEEIETVVSSLRVDCIVACIAHSSRSESLSLIRADGVYVNSCLAEPSMLLKDGDEFSVRGIGKFKFCGVFDKTRKERLKIKLKKYTTFTVRKDNK